MATLQSIPQELRLIITDHLHPQELFPFALTCRSYWKALAPTIQRKRLSERYRYLELRADGFIEFLQQARRNPLILSCVEQLAVDTWRAHSPPDLKQHDNVIKSIWPADFLTAFSANQLRSESSQVIESFKQAIYDGDQGALLAGIVLLLPNLRHLEWTLSHGNPANPWMLIALKLLRAAHDRHLPSLPLQRLNTLSLSDRWFRSNEVPLIDYDLLDWFMGIPSIRSVHLAVINGGFGEVRENFNSAFPLSGITNFHLTTDSTVAPQRIVDLFKRMGSLRKVSLLTFREANQDFDYRLVFEALEAYLKHSLEVLGFYLEDMLHANMVRPACEVARETSVSGLLTSGSGPARLTSRIRKASRPYLLLEAPCTCPEPSVRNGQRVHIQALPAKWECASRGF